MEMTECPPLAKPLPWKELSYISLEKGHNQDTQGHSGALGLGQEAEREQGEILGWSLYWGLPWEDSLEE